MYFYSTRLFFFWKSLNVHYLLPFQYAQMGRSKLLNTKSILLLLYDKSFDKNGFANCVRVRIIGKQRTLISIFF